MEFFVENINLLLFLPAARETLISRPIQEPL